VGPEVDYIFYFLFVFLSSSQRGVEPYKPESRELLQKPQAGRLGPINGVVFIYLFLDLAAVSKG
jgi:hypothetical protein